MLKGKPMTMCYLLAMCPYVPMSHRFFLYIIRLLMSTTYGFRGLDEITSWLLVNDTSFSFRYVLITSNKSVSMKHCMS